MDILRGWFANMHFSVYNPQIFNPSFSAAASASASASSGAELSTMDPNINSKEEEDDDQYGVLLYYKYTQIPDLDDLFSFYDSNCKSLSLLGRVRLSSLGVNVTVGGKLSALKKHIGAVELIGLFLGTDFKLAACGRPANDKVAEECGFTSLSIRIVKELVTLSCNPLIKSPEISHAGKHLTAAEFHSVLEKAGQLDKESKEHNRELVLLDARNLYETRIGKFHTPNVETLDPGIRQYSDLPSWIDDNSDRLQGKSVLMYCTGGIRCEMASAYIRSKGSGFENVFQLYGGIQRYLEQFPDGGFFRGKNFVFDHRISVGSLDANILGACLLCGTSYDDYSSRLRCNYCRMLVLVCDSCQRKGSVYVCELCQNHHKGVELTSSIKNGGIGSLPSVDAVSSDTKLSCQVPCRQATVPPRKLRILCLHGFRQNASSFKGRTASLAKKLKSIAELVFVDAPHELAFVYQLPSALRELPHNCTSPPTSPPQGSPLPPPSEHCNKKYAWLVAPDFHEKTETGNWEMVDGPFDPLQYQQQTEGFDESSAYIKTVFSQEGPFDGVLGFSQGAAMAAAIAFAQQTQRTSSETKEMQFRFVILCSGFGIKLLKQQFDENRMTKKCHCPSLHIFGKDHGKDRQIAKQESRELASLFDEGCSTVIEHYSGHIIPTRPPYIDQIKDFLSRFL